MLAVLIVAILFVNVFAVALVVARGLAWRTRIYRPMLLNVGLCAAPSVVLLLAVLVTAVAGALGGIWLTVVVLVVAGLVWLLLLPNSAYLVTELNLSHRIADDRVPLWYDIVLVISLAMTGVMTMALNVFSAQMMYAVTVHGDTSAALTRSDSLAVVAVVIVLVSLGMYLGRYLRLNSWDVRRPTRLWAKLRGHFRQRGKVAELVGFTVVHSVFLGIMCFTLLAPMLYGLSQLEQARR